MKTAERTGDYWVVDVEDVRDLEGGLPGYRHRFTFDGPDAAQRAWVCAADAEAAGFKSHAERARRA